jgi:fermentation-respiration switch protein FrsA (DUF1100 family)
MSEGWWVIDARSISRRALPAFAAALFLFLSSAAPAARGDAVDPAQPIASTPQLLLIHGGSFLFEDPSFEAETAPAAIAAGFEPHYLTYPLGDLAGAVTAARAAALELRARYGPDVYAYGTSAGGTLAALLSGEGLVSAAVAKAPPSDLLGWEWPLGVYGPDYYEQIGADPAARRRLSPLRRPALRPLLLVQGRADQVVPLAMSEAFAAKFPRVYLWATPGGHKTEQTHPWVLERALAWLAETAARQASAASL